MAKFIEVIHEWARMCKTYSNTNDRIKCPMARSSICGCISDDNGASNRKISEAEASKIEADIMSWAAKHPEPVYPTWEEWLITQGVIKENQNGGVGYPTRKLLESIPVNIAEKLRIEPKEE